MYRFKILILSLTVCLAAFSTAFSAGEVKKALEARGIKKIAVIPPVESKNYVIEYLKKEGVEAQLLTPQDFVNPEVFNAVNFPMAVYAGFEKYTQTVKEANDGDRALLSYITKGGTLFVLPAGPAPFFFNEKNRIVDSAGMIGLDIVKGKNDKFGTAMGFEKPMDGAVLNLNVQKDLKAVEGALPDKMPFPSKDDLRWRASVNRTASKSYIPLVSLSDDKGVWLGDAAAYKSGIIYAWFRLTQGDNANKDKVLSGLFKFAVKSKNLQREDNPALAQLEKSYQLASKFKNIKIALLPSAIQTSLETWMQKQGIDFDKLSWEDVVDQQKFNAANYKIAVYTGGEKYNQTVKSFADVDDALIKFQNEKGMLILASYEPWPLCINQDNASTNLVGKLGFPICGIDDSGNLISDVRLAGFEKPKEGVKVNFVINTGKLPSFNPKLAFPTEGDLRWRPVNGTAMGKSDIYVPLVSLYDSEDNSYGDGIAYFERKETQPVNGKGLYVWNRANDLMDSDKLYGDLFNFIADINK